jgi:putative mRNA 3-end processing factor
MMSRVAARVRGLPLAHWFPAHGGHHRALLTEPVAMTPDTGDLIVERPEGLYCPPGRFHIDPWRAVERAVITHAHADHARADHRHVLAVADSEPVLRARLGRLSMQGLAYGEALELDGVRVSLHPAGHVFGSAQVRVEHLGRVWVVSGDYYLSDHDESNPTCAAFEPLRCDCFVTESTFGLPLYRWRPQVETLAQINAWWRDNARERRPSLLAAYSFGKAQRLLAASTPASARSSCIAASMP